jgi:hypothetical protein
VEFFLQEEFNTSMCLWDKDWCVDVVSESLKNDLKIILCLYCSNNRMVWLVSSKLHLKFCSCTGPIKKRLYTKFQLLIRCARMWKNYSKLECTIEILASWQRAQWWRETLLSFLSDVRLWYAWRNLAIFSKPLNIYCLQCSLIYFTWRVLKEQVSLICM